MLPTVRAIRPHRLRRIAAIVIVSATSAAAAEPGSGLQEHIFRIEPSAAIDVRLDATWTNGSTYHSGRLKEIRFLREKGRRAKLLLTALVPLPTEALLGPAQEVLKLVEQSVVAELGGRSIEKKLEAKQQRAGEAEIFFVTATDPQPKPGEFLRSTQGILRIHAVPFSFTLLHSEPEVRDEVFAIIGKWSGYGTANRASAQSQPSKAGLEAACDRGDGLACGLANELFGQEEVGKQDVLKRASAGCTAGSPFACGTLGALYDQGEGVAKDETKALGIFMRACQNHGALACLNAFKMIEQKRGNLPKGASSDANFYIDRACWFGGDLEGACRAGGGENLSAEEYQRRQSAGCTKGDTRACRLLGWGYETGYGTTTDVARALDAYKKACHRGDIYACFRQALFTPDAAQQAKLYAAACEQGSGLACYNMTLPPYGLPADKRFSFLRRACEGEVQDACAAVAGEIERQSR